MDMKRRQPIGIELVKRGIITEAQIQTALDYQKKNPKSKLGDIINDLNMCDSQLLINTIGEILGEKPILIQPSDVKVKMEEYVSLDVLKRNDAVIFDIDSGKAMVCFSDTSNRRKVETIRLLLLNKGLILEQYITFQKNINQILNSLDGKVEDKISIGSDITGTVDSIIKTGMSRRTSDIHFEPMENSLRVRYRIDGQLFTVADIEKEKQAQVIGRLKAISGMHQEKQESQDGKITIYPDYNIRVSSQKNVYGEKFVLRLLKKNSDVKQLLDLGFPSDEKTIKNSFDKKNSVTIMAAPTGEGKTTSLYSIIQFLDKPEINITTIEDPVEIRIPGLNQIEIDSKTSFLDALRTVLRQDPDIILVGEIRDKETAEIAMQAGQTGHYVLSTIHTIDAIEVITRLRKMGISNYDISSTLATTVSQRLVRRICPNCAVERPFTKEEKDIIMQIGEKYGVEFDLKGKTTYKAVGCKQCNNVGYLGRIGIFEILILDEKIRELISEDASTMKIREEALKGDYKPLVIDGINKVLQGITTLEEIDRKVSIF